MKKDFGYYLFVLMFRFDYFKYSSIEMITCDILNNIFIITIYISYPTYLLGYY